MDIDEYVVRDKHNTNDDFRIEWPLKSSVTHPDLGGVSVRVMSRPQKLDDVIFRKAAGRK